MFCQVSIEDSMVFYGWVTLRWVLCQKGTWLGSREMSSHVLELDLKYVLSLTKESIRCMEKWSKVLEWHTALPRMDTLFWKCQLLSLFMSSYKVEYYVSLYTANFFLVFNSSKFNPFKNIWLKIENKIMIWKQCI